MRTESLSNNTCGAAILDHLTGIGWGIEDVQIRTLSGVASGVGANYRSKTNLSVKVLDFVQLGGPTCTEASTVFEMWLGGL